MNLAFHEAKGRNRGFTMIEIAISIGVIGFALVAIIGILPAGMNVQKDNREDTIINQDANFFMQAIRNGAVLTNDTGFSGTMVRGTGLDFLTNYVDGIRIYNTNSSGGLTSYYYTNNPAYGMFFTPNPRAVSSGAAILGLLSTPSFYVGNITNLFNGLPSTNYVRAWVRALNGSALEQNGSNSLVAFRYVMDVQITPFISFPNAMWIDASWSNRLAQAQYISHNLFEARLTFHWPVLANNALGPNNQTFRTVISASLARTNIGQNFVYYYFQPQTYAAATLR